MIEYWPNSNCYRVFVGTGKITINGQDITYFEGVQPREQVSVAFYEK